LASPRSRSCSSPFAYVWLTHRLVKESRAARVGADLAVLAITYAGEVGLSEPEGLRHAFAAHVVNVGNGPAVQLDAKLRLGDQLLEFRDDRVARERIYIMEGWEAPEWRAPWRAETPPDPPE
jgi:hypothetical protein